MADRTPSLFSRSLGYFAAILLCPQAYSLGDMKAVYEQVISDLAFAVSKLELRTDDDTDADLVTKRRIVRVLKKALVKLQAMASHDL